MSGIVPTEEKKKLERLVFLKQRKTQIAAEEKALNEEQARLYEELLPLFEEMPRVALEVDGKTRTFFRKQESFPKIENMQAFKAWAEANGRSDMIVEAVPTLRSLCTEKRKENLPLPDGVSTYDKNTIGITGS